MDVGWPVEESVGGLVGGEADAGAVDADEADVEGGGGGVEFRSLEAGGGEPVEVEDGGA